MGRSARATFLSKACRVNYTWKCAGRGLSDAAPLGVVPSILKGADVLLQTGLATEAQEAHVLGGASDSR
eukprot:7831391-Alexandrium_andersonii.AAC.1